MSGEREEEVFLLPSRDLKGVNNSPWAPKSLGKYPEGKPAWASGRGLAIAAVDMTAMRILDICMIEMVWRHEDSVEKSEIWYLYVCISQWILLYCRMANIRTVCIAFTWSPILFHISSCPGTFWKLKRGLKSFAKMLCVGRKVNQINLVLKSFLCLIEDLLSIPSTARKWYPLDWENSQYRLARFVLRLPTMSGQEAPILLRIDKLLCCPTTGCDSAPFLAGAISYRLSDVREYGPGPFTRRAV